MGVKFASFFKTIEICYNISANLILSLLREAEGTGPEKLGNLQMQGAKSCGMTGR